MTSKGMGVCAVTRQGCVCSDQARMCVQWAALCPIFLYTVTYKITIPISFSVHFLKPHLLGVLELSDDYVKWCFERGTKTTTGDVAGRHLSLKCLLMAQNTVP